MQNSSLAERGGGFTVIKGCLVYEKVGTGSCLHHLGAGPRVSREDNLASGITASHQPPLNTPIGPRNTTGSGVVT